MNTGTRQHHRAPRATASPVAVIDLSESELAESYELPGGEHAPDDQALEILTEQADEFTCSSCFFIRPRSQLAKPSTNLMYCRDCEG